MYELFVFRDLTSTITPKYRGTCKAKADYKSVLLRLQVHLHKHLYMYVDQHGQEALLTHLHTFILFTFISNHVSILAICSAQFTRDLAIIFIFGKPPSAWKINSVPCLGILNSYLKSKSVQDNCQIKLQKNTVYIKIHKLLHVYKDRNKQNPMFSVKITCLV